jgi:hypothetical protein
MSLPQNPPHESIVELFARVHAIEHRLEEVATDVDEVDRRIRPYGDGTSDRDRRKSWPHTSRYRGRR